MRFTGAVLTGGRSSRMGTDKAFVEVGGEPMVHRARRALDGAGATELLAIGGDQERLRAAGFVTVPDSAPGEGPLGGVVDALEAASESVVVILACDQPGVDAHVIRQLVHALQGDVDVVVPADGERLHPTPAAYAVWCAAMLRRAFDDGERAPSRAIQRLRWHALRGLPNGAFDDVDVPEDLARYAARHVDDRDRPRTRGE